MKPTLVDPSAAARAAAGVDTIFYTVGVPYTQFALHPKLIKIALEAAASTHVKRFVHVSTVYPYGIPQTDFVNESHPRNPVAFKGKMRKEQEDLVFAADQPGGMRTTILRPPDFLRTGRRTELYALDIRRCSKRWDGQCDRPGRHPT